MAAQASGGFVWYELMTGDLDQAIAFYGAVAGWDVRDSGMPGMRYLLFGQDGKDVGGMMSWHSIGMSKPTQWMGHIFTAHVDTEIEEVVVDGGRQVRPPTDIPGVGRFAVAADPQGAEFLLFQPNGDAMPPRLEPHEPGAVGWHELVTTDWQKAWGFYSSHYGWQKDQAVDMGPMGIYQTFTQPTGGGGGMMNLPPAQPEYAGKPGWLFYFTVDDIAAAAQRVRDGGGSITQEPRQVPGGAWMLHALDNQGGRFALTAAK